MSETVHELANVLIAIAVLVVVLVDRIPIIQQHEVLSAGAQVKPEMVGGTMIVTYAIVHQLVSRKSVHNG